MNYRAMAQAIRNERVELLRMHAEAGYVPAWSKLVYMSFGLDLPMEQMEELHRVGEAIRVAMECTGTTAPAPHPRTNRRCSDLMSIARHRPLLFGLSVMLPYTAVLTWALLTLLPTMPTLPKPNPWCVLDATDNPAMMRCKHCHTTQAVRFPVDMNHMKAMADNFLHQHGYCYLKPEVLRQLIAELSHYLKHTGPGASGYTRAQAYLLMVGETLRRQQSDSPSQP